LPPAARARYDQLLAGTRASFGAAQFDAAFAAGKSMSLEQVSADAQAMLGTRRPGDANNSYDTSALPAEPSLESGPRLVIAQADGPRIIPLSRMPLTIGRESNTDIALNDPRVSRQHARLSYREQQIWLTDLRSSNGTFVNGTPIQEHALQPGDQLSFGGLEAIFEDAMLPAR
jgi:pSer/pThr/pTyr-binding forkhead associated (FHA) protein